MYWWHTSLRHYIEAMDDGDFNEKEGHVRAWSLAALLDYIPLARLESIKQCDKPQWRCYSFFVSDLHDKSVLDLYNSDWYDNPVDACYELILKLSEFKVLQL